MAGYRRTLSTALPQRRLGHGASPPHPYPKLGLPTLLARSRGELRWDETLQLQPHLVGGDSGWMGAEPPGRCFPQLLSLLQANTLVPDPDGGEPCHIDVDAWIAPLLEGS